MTNGHPILRFTDEAMAALRELAQTNPNLWKDPDTDFIAVLKELGVNSPTEATGLVAALPIQMPSPKEGSKRQQVDRHSLTFLDNIEGMTAAHMADPNLLAWMSCVPLLAFGIKRWPPAINHGPVKWVEQHFLGQRGRDLTDYSVAGRPLWIARHSRTVAGQIPSKKEEKILDHFSNNPEHYHQCTNYQIMRSPIILSEFVFAAMGKAEGISRQGIRELARDINRAAGAKLLDSMTRNDIRQIVQAATSNLMAQPQYVADRSKLQIPPTLTVLSLGAGVQSTVMALMAEHNYLDFKKPDFAIFADTGWEPKAVYDNVAWLKTQLSYPIIEVSGGNIKDSILSGINPEGRPFIDMPLYLQDENGKRSVATRQCTRVYKMDPIYRTLRAKLGLTKGQRAQNHTWVEMWLGITTDEADRQKPSRREWITNRYPLIENSLSRIQLFDWFTRHYAGRELPKSACIGCPFHTNAIWAEMKQKNPSEFQDAVAVDWALRNVPQARGSLKGTGYLHKSMIPLSEVDLSTTTPESDAMRAECEGICGV